MPLTVDVEEGAARWHELLAEVSAGREVIIAQGSQPVAKLTRPVHDPKRSVADEIREGRKDFAPVSIDEIIAWRDEGRR